MERVKRTRNKNRDFILRGGIYMEFIKAKNYRKKTVILPCPFCGENEEIYLEQYEHTVGKRWRILCCSCMAQIDRGYDQTPGILIDLWNIRK